MNPRSLLSERTLAIAIALIRTAVCAYRAATQSFVADEAFTFNTFVAGSWRNLYFQYEANNHLLFSLLSKLSMSIFGDSESALRLPSVIASFFLMIGVWCVLESVQSRAVRWVAFAAIALNPLMLDFSAAARGYGLAVALLVWALFAGITQRYKTAGILLGLAVSANLYRRVLPLLDYLRPACFWEMVPLSGRPRAGPSGWAFLAVVPFVIACGGVSPILRVSNFGTWDRRPHP